MVEFVLVVDVLLMSIRVQFGEGRGGLRGLIGLGRGLDGRVGGGSGRLLLRLGRTLLIYRLSLGRDYIIGPAVVSWLCLFVAFSGVMVPSLDRDHIIGPAIEIY